MKDIKGYEGLYAITEEGKVWSYRRDKYLKIVEDVKGNTKVYLYKGKLMSYKVDKLVAEAFIDNPNNYRQIRHKDGNDANNRADNLEWCYSVYNNCPFNITTYPCNIGKKVQCVETGITYKNMTEAYKQTGISNSSISNVLHGRAKTAGGYHWRLADE